MRSDMIAAGVAWLDRQRRQHLSSSVTYKRDNLEVDVLATFGHTTYEIVDESGQSVKAKGVDFIISVQDLVEAGFGEPLLGDQVIVKSGSDKGLIYVALELVGGNHYVPHGPHGYAVRIHTKLIGPCE